MTRANAPAFQLCQDFRDPLTARRWHGLHDVVMGGVSSGGLRATARATAVFSGTVSLARGGGFASVRSEDSDWDLRAHAGLLLRLRGDGHRYQLRLRTHAAGEGLHYTADFETADGCWSEVYVAFAELAPTVRGRRAPDAPEFDPGRIRSFGLLIAAEQAGEFELELQWIGACSSGPERP